jgi:uncharacterized protein YdeI (YjbR/CyaY-like superfamily)
MSTKDPRVDAYIAKAGDFAKPLLRHLRQLVHTACPDVQETMKWSVPHFDYKGMMCGMAAFKSHCKFGFWKSSLVLDGPSDSDAAGQFDRITSLADLPPDSTLVRYVKKAAALNDAGVKAAKKPTAPKKPLPLPPDFAAALKKNRAAKQTFDAFSPSHRREYIEWVTEAKTDTTREKRLQTSVTWLKAGKARNWKYERAR